MIPSNATGHEDFDGLTQHFIAPVPEEVFGRCVCKDHAPAIVYHDYGCGKGGNDRRKMRNRKIR
jgi:hypothetical protein